MAAQRDETTVILLVAIAVFIAVASAVDDQTHRRISVGVAADAHVLSDIHMPVYPFTGDRGSALHPYISERTLSMHWNGNLKGYVDKLNLWLGMNHPPPRPATTHSLVTHLIRTMPPSSKVHNLAGQIFNHLLYFRALRANQSALSPESELGKQVIASFGSIDAFVAKFKAVANDHFGSGWAWLLHNKTASRLFIIDTHDAATPIAEDDSIVPLAVIDVWEHSYVLDVENKRAQYVDNVLAVIDWAFVESRLVGGQVEYPGPGDVPTFTA